MSHKLELLATIKASSFTEGNSLTEIEWKAHFLKKN